MTRCHCQLMDKIPAKCIPLIEAFVSPELLEMDKTDVSRAFCVGRQDFVVNELVSRPQVISLLHSKGLVIAFPFVIEALSAEPAKSIELAECFLFRLGFGHPFVPQDLARLDKIRPSSLTNAAVTNLLSPVIERTAVRRREQEERAMLIQSLSAEQCASALAAAEKLDAAYDPDVSRMLKKIRRWRRKNQP